MKLSSVKEKAQTLPEQESRITLSERDFLAFTAAIQRTFTPNPALQKALASAAKIKRA
ncbi:hypothetical protein MIZ03_1281 [Rhodoferax lithotrophicus]|uniref:DUF1778 domain-containing protein n=1 Tax=Rhodoferax lithotrophicus TaxID=2798804 RepID=A0ABM7MJN8_9BURK|nr:DUF1778 domain-containing protein [Rhodoferax sp. MIZ03]BCO26399.1 hypothetical protein MIZ03_1281 [Rhodoferax sp. MIZ03]